MTSKPGKSPSSKPARAPVTGGMQLVPGFSTLLDWAKGSPLATILGVLAAATLIFFAVRTASTEEGIVWSLVAVAALVAFAWAILVLQKYPTAPLPAKLLAWCLCVSGGIIVLTGATKLVATTLGWDPSSWRSRQLSSCAENKKWHPIGVYEMDIFPTNRTKKLYPSKVYARERQTGQYEICAIWVPIDGVFHSHDWMTPREFAQKHLQLEGHRLMSFETLTLNNGSVRVQATWVEESEVASLPERAVATLDRTNNPM